jgi:hypothetical protein
MCGRQARSALAAHLQPVRRHPALRHDYGFEKDRDITLAIVSTAVTLFPVVKRQNEGIALGYVAFALLKPPSSPSALSASLQW